MSNPARKATMLGLIANTFLFIIKLAAGMMSGSLALLSDAMNSFSDTVYSVGLVIAIKVSQQEADKDHPFGHHGAEPVAAMMIAMMMGIVGFEIVKEGALGVFSPRPNTFSLFGAIVLLISMVLKTGMWRYFKRVSESINSPAIHASSIDGRNDVLISLTALIGISGSLFGIEQLDCYAGILIGLFIIKSGYDIAIENIDYLMGKTPSEEILKEIRKRASKVKGVLGTNDIRAHYVGNYVHVEVHIEVNKNLNTQHSHDIGKQVQELVEDMPQVDKAFIHVDPM